ncbi:glycoside hydrolase family 43 protein [Pedobacter sp. PF22-3]|uniref:glycoside hydrolase family 43 protein n=1 Tax=Pedobacter sp. PF22-3 TaxID=2994467 RepID=UPI0022454720|nr:glycoside hydrolase family 43 protein [Pedobacter sp. PF22-3]MCX2492609.1 glycoside hydrolase family 43 protein [Pedobacter sp. PF22-3]
MMRKKMKFSRYVSLAVIAKLLLIMNISLAQTVIEPVIAGDFADPSIIRTNNQYYAVGTSSEWAPHFPIYSSKDLLNWKQTGYVFEKAPAWTSGSFWAPEYDYHDKTYFIYYTARRKKDNISCIGVATSKYPDRGFVDQGIIIDYGKEAIDAFIYLDGNTRYITFKAYGLDKRPIEILAYKLTKNGLKVEREPFSLLKDDQKIGLEGQSILKKDGYYYLFYSAGNCCGVQCDYNVRVARSTSFAGPYELYAANPLLMENEYWKCSGHGTFVKAADGKDYYLYHAYNKKTNVFSGRQGMLAQLSWSSKGGWPVLKEQSGPTLNRDLKLKFTKPQIDKNWQWDFRNSTPKISQQNGQLHLSGSINKDNLSGIALTIRPVSGIFEATTTVTNTNNALKGLVYYGDSGSAVGIGISGNEIEFWKVENKARTVLSKLKVSVTLPLELKMKTTDDLSLMVFFKQGNQEWQNMPAKEKIAVNFLPQWDRSPRIGLHFNGSAGQGAHFSSFALKY